MDDGECGDGGGGAAGQQMTKEDDKGLNINTHYMYFVLFQADDNNFMQNLHHYMGTCLDFCCCC